MAPVEMVEAAWPLRAGWVHSCVLPCVFLLVFAHQAAVGSGKAGAAGAAVLGLTRSPFSVSAGLLPGR